MEMGFLVREPAVRFIVAIHGPCAPNPVNDYLAYNLSVRLLQRGHMVLCEGHVTGVPHAVHRAGAPGGEVSPEFARDCLAIVTESQVTVATPTVPTGRTLLPTQFLARLEEATIDIEDDISGQMFCLTEIPDIVLILPGIDNETVSRIFQGLILGAAQNGPRVVLMPKELMSRIGLLHELQRPHVHELPDNNFSNRRVDDTMAMIQQGLEKIGFGDLALT